MSNSIDKQLANIQKLLVQLEGFVSHDITVLTYKIQGVRNDMQEGWDEDA